MLAGPNADREFVVLTGPDGRDGSAIVRAIAGLAKVSQGEIRFDDRMINEVPAKDRDLAFLSHDYEPYPRLSVYENLAIGLKRRQFGETEIKKRIMTVSEALEMRDRLEISAQLLSSVERTFLGLARAMVRQPRVYLFDRPFANLDRTEASRGRAAVAGLRQRSSATIIYAADDPAEALAFDIRTVIIAGGAIQQDANARSVYDSPANLAVAKFFGNPPMNLVRGILKVEPDGVVFVEEGEGTIALDLPSPRFAGTAAPAGKPVVLGFNAESIEIASSEGSNRPATTFRALVERAEPRGAQTALYLQTGAHQLICQTARWDQGGGRRLQFGIDLAKAHLFDAETGQRTTSEP
jgi:multiple sugar transport system ATP-binding protein